MTASLRRRLAVFCGVVAALIALAAWSAVTAWLELGRLRGRFNAAQFESFRIAGELEGSVLSLGGALLAYELGGDPQSWTRFQQDSHELDIWIDNQRTALKTNEEKRALAEIDAEYDRFLASANTFHSEHGDRTVSVSDRVRQIENAEKQMISLAGRLAEAHRHALGDLISESRRSLQRLEVLLGAGFIFVLAVGAWGARVVYDETVAPLRRQLLETQMLAQRQEKLAALGVLAAGVAHEIRNPLMAIKLRAYLLRQNLEDGAPAGEDVRVIDNEITHLERIVSDFLLFARPSDPNLTTMAPHALLSEVRELLAPELAKNQVALVVESEADIPSFRADQQQLKQVLINLVRNAAESIAFHGRVTLRIRRDRLKVGGELRDVVVIEVGDTGAGIPAEIQERLFDPFFTTKPTGTGLGLSIAMRILEKHGGTLQFQTEPGKGTTFGMVLPIEPEKRPLLALDAEIEPTKAPIASCGLVAREKMFQQKRVHPRV
jgi:signal transduction histidine kinase